MFVVIFGISAALIAYVVFAYPLLLGFVARRFGRPVHKQALRPAVSVLIPVHNGERFIRAKLASVAALDYPRELVETIVLADGCTDSTEAIAREFPGVDVVRLPRGGKPAALNHGFARARHDILVLTDARQPLAPDSVARLVENFADPSVGTVSGELVITSGATQDEADVGLYWRFESWVRNQLSAVDSMFGATGPFYAIRRELARPMPADILLDDMYLPLTAFFKGFRLIVEPAAKARDFPTSVNTEFRRKVRTLAGNYQLLTHLPALLGPRNRMWWHYVSYKLGRLLLPYALAAAFISGLFLPAPANIVVTAAQLLFYLLAVADTVIPQAAVLKRVSSPARTFTVMMAAAVCAVSVFFVPPQRLWKVTTDVRLDKDAAG